LELVERGEKVNGKQTLGWAFLALCAGSVFGKAFRFPINLIYMAIFGMGMVLFMMGYEEGSD